MKGSTRFVVSALMMMCSTVTWAGDWPMWRHDARRANVSVEAAPANPRLQWKRQLPVMKPAFRKARLQFDQGYEPIVMGDTLLVAVPHVDALVAYDAASGKERWRFYTDGPVRLAPVAWRDRVLFGSDDGCFYCLNIADGQVEWKFRAVPSPRKILGNGRLISVWPVRGGAVLADGIVYFAAGVWPLEGVFVYALKAETGEVVWRNERCGSLYGRQPHNAQALGGLSPQGYLLVDGDKLLVPCGTARPASFDRRTGELIEFSLPGAGRLPGGWFMMLNPQMAKDFRRGKIRFDSGVNRERHEDKEMVGNGESGLRKRIVLAGTTLKYSDGFEGVSGEIHTVLAANGRLFIVTLEGVIYCFADKPGTPGEFQKVTEKRHPVATALGLPQAIGERSGYALVLGTHTGELARQLSTDAEYHVVAVTPDPGDLKRLRRRFNSPEVAPGRLVFLPGRLVDLDLPPYLADLIVEESAAVAKPDADRIVAIYERLRPYGGVACLRLSGDETDEIRGWLASANHAEAVVERVGEYTVIRRNGALPGAVDYTRNWSAPDARVRAPLGILWFGDAIAHFKRSPQPDILGGIMVSRDKAWLDASRRFRTSGRLHVAGSARFVLGEPQFMDVYTGRVLRRPEASSRLRKAPVSPASSLRPPYQYRPPYVTDIEVPGERGRPFLRKMNKGQMTNPLTGLVEPRRYVKSYGCDGGNDYGQLITMRSATPAFYDKRIESGTINISGPRSGCTNSIIPANGILNMPFFYDGCTCSYPLPTGAALVSMPETFEQWTAWGAGDVGPIVRVGINLGAPGDRMTRKGTLFVDAPSVGGPSPNIAWKIQPEGTHYFYRHSLFSEGGTGWPWVCASGAVGLTSFQLDGLKPGRFTVRLYFAEPRSIGVGERVFDVMLQGKTVLKGLDIVAVAGGSMRSVVREFPGISIDGRCELVLTAHRGKPLLSGIELVSEGLELDVLDRLPAAGM
jgi:outer membrane protein assembly factor BamB